MMKVLVTGTDGYIGVMLGQALARRGYEVVGLDTGFYRDGWLSAEPQTSQTQLCKDVRQVTVDDLRGFDAVFHLAELSNDPLGAHNPELTFDINHKGSVALAAKAKAAGVRRFIYSSSCSVYGAGTDDVKTEESDPNPLTAYARCKVLVEQDVRAMANRTFCPTFLRNATAFGASPRMRFDVVLNNLAGLAWTTGKITMTSNGLPWRPLVHVLDICEAMVCTLEAPEEAVHGEIFNVGDSRFNYRVKEIAQMVGTAFPGCEVVFGTNDQDSRSYRVSFDKIHAHLPAFQCTRDAAMGARQLFDLFSQLDMIRDDFEFRAYTRLKQLKYLLRTHKVDECLYWR
jgi:nucleoside-diphosphate-sugar epimerase